MLKSYLLTRGQSFKPIALNPRPLPNSPHPLPALSPPVPASCCHIFTVWLSQTNPCLSKLNISGASCPKADMIWWSTHHSSKDKVSEWKATFCKSPSILPFCLHLELWYKYTDLELRENFFQGDAIQKLIMYSFSPRYKRGKKESVVQTL